MQPRAWQPQRLGIGCCTGRGCGAHHDAAVTSTPTDLRASCHAGTHRNPHETRAVFSSLRSGRRSRWRYTDWARCNPLAYAILLTLRRLAGPVTACDSTVTSKED